MEAMPACHAFIFHESIAHRPTSLANVLSADVKLRSPEHSYEVSFFFGRRLFLFFFLPQVLTVSFSQLACARLPTPLVVESLVGVAVVAFEGHTTSASTCIHLIGLATAWLLRARLPSLSCCQQKGERSLPNCWPKGEESHPRQIPEPVWF